MQLNLWNTVALVVTLGWLVAGAAPATITGTFIQLNGQLAQMSLDEWMTELGYMKDIGFDTVIIQYSVYGGNYYFPSKQAETSIYGPDESVNSLAWKGGGRARYLRIVVEPTSVEWTMIAEVTVRKGDVNLSLGKPYTITPLPSPKYPDPHLKKLTDGRANFSWGDMVGWRLPASPIQITIDLGEVKSFDSVEVKFMRSEISNVQIPTGGFQILISNDGKSFLAAGQASWESNAVSVNADAVEHILKAAEELGMHVFVGLGLDPEYWSGKFDGQKEALKNQKLLTELYDLYGHYKSLAGWYLPEELDDRNFTSQKRIAAVKTYLRNMGMYAKLYTGKPTMVSPYFGMNPNPGAYAAWWDAVLSEAHVDIVAMQDGVGCHRTTIAEAVAVLKALRPVLEKHGVELWANVEVFDQTHGWPVDDRAWDATSAPPDRVIKQLTAEAPHVVKVIMFDFTSYMSPRLGGKARELYEGYKEYLARRG